ncbi:galactoside O-acetyltransferase [Tetragenococcus halophilus subsp. halophilus]|uniref:Acetyltransferase n=1 Tax=Tetragenococcus halophilus (strain DSM 20338 / JCM 20259 / NCIMB 9735 / NBRC 12172) TaxID=945021 RepID=A0AAN1SI88_TETHN|nr:sugar O-acetyltransferase [Tetragenococcus halophilus]BAK95307.1 galactoside O-acetyltransferase [Tetragenococcus halophilus NBRC 12172]GBD80097.1 galactoside O-acetyltransferase [Tetragenococcus halophilus subsp. halophilus]GBD81380.1 galactoside O-acetyltransferase [Tetragenococcus halophilus subsp. halophilus]GMG65510.1 sugar O-acetyltransferase [Tetragenococcus halophilus]
MDTNEIKRRMNSGEIYYENAEIEEESLKYSMILHSFNQLEPEKSQKRREYLEKLFGEIGANTYIEQPLHANWGKNTFLGDNVYANFNLTLVDDTRIEIHDDTMIGPNVTIITGTHPLDSSLRRNNAQYNLPVTIEENVWIGAGAIILPGTHIGKNSIIGAASLVTQNIPENVLAYGSPCKVIKEID